MARGEGEYARRESPWREGRGNMLSVRAHGARGGGICSARRGHLGEGERRDLGGRGGKERSGGKRAATDRGDARGERLKPVEDLAHQVW
eukprot:1195467-Prorocentrum_minimum.AAC.3